MPAGDGDEGGREVSEMETREERWCGGVSWAVSACEEEKQCSLASIRTETQV
jgi:hypothetical protein